jgi:hypothetical protein
MCALQPVARDRGHLSLLTFILAESWHTRKYFTWTANRLGEEEFPAGPRRYSENLPHGPLPPFA